MFNNDQWSSAALFFLGLLVAYISISYGIGSIHSPGTGFMPFYTGVTICILAGGVFTEATLSGKKGIKWNNPFAKLMWWRPLIALAALMVYVMLLNTLGFLLDTVFLVGFMLRAFQPYRWFVVVLGAILTSVITYLVFKVCLETALPSGVFKF